MQKSLAPSILGLEYSGFGALFGQISAKAVMLTAG